MTKLPEAYVSALQFRQFQCQVNFSQLVLGLSTKLVVWGNLGWDKAKIHTFVLWPFVDVSAFCVGYTHILYDGCGV